MTSVMRILSYGVAADVVDDYVRIGKNMTIESLKYFCNSIIKIFGPKYLRSVATTDIARLLAIGRFLGFRYAGKFRLYALGVEKLSNGMARSMRRPSEKANIILKAVVSYDLWIWHSFFGMSGSHNDLNVLDRSPLFSDLAQGKAPHVHYTLNGHTYNMDYYLADGMYPQWATLVQTISSLQGAKK
ncbi:uncharacterized protein LOC114273868 [Camellia sinensis]|uniref:uncharacterized protein LOC114273868 n=1 Tax=Camellia sinensis TaxID=4442 RepID=UPI0010366503|nr:uncharacterized protein LOC114273868 [Camellia sinensis]